MSIERLRRSDGRTVYVVRWYESGRGSTKRKRTFDRLRGLASLRCGLEETERAQDAVVCLDEVVAGEAGSLRSCGTSVSSTLLATPFEYLQQRERRDQRAVPLIVRSVHSGGDAGGLHGCVSSIVI
jgi:hypothetical protein